jgi:putative ABC transport system ATP-binding protein
VTAAEVLALLRNAVDALGATVVMVTHDPVAAGWADRVLFLADGHLVDELRGGSAARIGDRMRALSPTTSPAGVA